jgi:hypothetical protein
MPDFLTDQEIAELLTEEKPLPADWRKRLVLKAKRGHSESELDVSGARGSEFRILQRRSNLNPLDFSVILAYRFPGSNQVLRLRRYNGKSHEHRNRLEGNRFYDFHVHTATARYQRTGHEEDSFAEVTDRYATIEEATRCLFADCAIKLPDDAQGELF